MSNEKKELVTKEEAGLPAADLFELVNVESLVKILQERIAGAWAYEFPLGNKKVRGLSSPGADEVANYLAKASKGQHVVRIISGTQKVIEEIDEWTVDVEAGVYMVNSQGNSILLNTSMGSASQPKIGTRVDGSEWDVNHPRTQAIRKACRNAICHLIPEKIKEAVIIAALKAGKVEKEDEKPKSVKTQPPSSHNGFIPATKEQFQKIESLLEDDSGIPKEYLEMMAKFYARNHDKLSEAKAQEIIDKLNKLIVENIK